MRHNLAHLSDAVLLRELAALVDQDRSTTANLLAHIAEVDARRLYAPAGYSSMFAYCVEELRLSEDSAYKRIRAARAARYFPALFTALAEGRVHLAGICLIAGHLTRENANELIEAATHRKKADIEEWLARRFPLPESPAVVRAIAARPTIAARPAIVPGPQLAPGPVRSVELHPEGADSQPSSSPLELAIESAPAGVDQPATDSAPAGADRLATDSAPAGSDQLAPGPVENPSPEQLSAAEPRFLVQVTISKSTHDKLRYAQALLSHAIAKGNVAEVLDRALDALIAEVEKRRLGNARPERTSETKRSPRSARESRRPSPARARYIATHVRRAVWERDRGQCTFVSASGTRCMARQFLEFDHVEPVARGGKPTVEGLRLRCRAHNQYEAERAFGADFMTRKRGEARLVAAKRRLARLAAERARAQARLEHLPRCNPTLHTRE